MLNVAKTLEMWWFFIYLYFTLQLLSEVVYKRETYVILNV